MYLITWHSVINNRHACTRTKRNGCNTIFVTMGRIICQELYMLYIQWVRIRVLDGGEQNWTCIQPISSDGCKFQMAKLCIPSRRHCVSQSRAYTVIVALSSIVV